MCAFILQILSTLYTIEDKYNLFLLKRLEHSFNVGGLACDIY